MINATTGKPGTGMTFTTSPADVSEAARTVVAPAAPFQSGEPGKSSSRTKTHLNPVGASPGAIAGDAQCFAFDDLSLSDDIKCQAACTTPITPSKTIGQNNVAGTEIIYSSLVRPHSASLRSVALRSSFAFELAKNNPATPFALVCALGVRSRALSALAQRPAHRPRVAGSPGGVRSIPDGNHGDNTFPIHISVCEGKS